MVSKNNIKVRLKAAGNLAKVMTIVSALFVMLCISAPLLPFSLNLTPSMPRGLYYTYDCSPIKGDIIQFRPDEGVWQFALERGYITDRMEGMIKTIVATSGDRICWRGGKVYINGEILAEVAQKDSNGRPLGHEPECVTLAKGQFLPMAPDYPKSYDGRYFGLINSENVKSCARAVLTF